MVTFDPLALFEMPRSAYRLKTCPVCRCALALRGSHTYVVQRQGWVKIGASSNVRRRLSELARQAWAKHLLSPPDMDWTEPLVVIAVITGDVEHDLHERFAAAHVLGEWFLPDPPMRRWLASLQDQR